MGKYTSVQQQLFKTVVGFDDGGRLKDQGALDDNKHDDKFVCNNAE